MTDGLTTDQWLARVFTAPRPADLAQAYDEWADAYERDMLGVGYVHPSVAMGLFGRHVADLDGTVLDAGCGSGALGVFLSVLGYRSLVGLDMSGGMLRAAGNRGVYASLVQAVLGERLPFEDGVLDTIVSLGTFTIGHAPPRTLDEFVRIIKPGGQVIMTISDHGWKAGGFGPKIEALLDAGIWTMIEATRPYRPMPLSVAEGHLESRMFVFRA